MTRTHGNVEAQLAPVLDALLRTAQTEADAVLAQADLEVADELALADAQAEELLDRSRAQFASDAAVLVAAEHSRVLREARSVELRARRAAYDALVAAVSAALLDQAATDPEVVAALTERARMELGPEAVLAPTPDGGLDAEAGGRRLRLPLTSLVEGAVADLLTSRDTP
jgi:vacuolar-type H+-ATPase subunit E/Vma4